MPWLTPALSTEVLVSDEEVLSESLFWSLQDSISLSCSQPGHSLSIVDLRTAQAIAGFDSACVHCIAS
eukprot:749320-Rhodomonas_salina.3